MVRRRRSRSVYSRRPVKSVKYSNETQTFNASIDVSTSVPVNYAQPIVVPLAQQGTRKVKNFTLTIATDSASPILWALVYVPEGTKVSSIPFPDGNIVSLYEPNQNVIMSGMVSDDNFSRVRSRLARNLNSGDAIYLMFRSNFYESEGQVNLQGVLNYAICY